MSPRVRKGLIVAALHLALVASLGAKMLADRAIRPRVWARVVPFDPNLPIRGRYVRMAIEGAADQTVHSVYDGYFQPAVQTTHSSSFRPATATFTARSNSATDATSSACGSRSRISSPSTSPIRRFALAGRNCGSKSLCHGAALPAPSV